MVVEAVGQRQASTLEAPHERLPIAGAGRDPVAAFVVRHRELHEAPHHRHLQEEPSVFEAVGREAIVADHPHAVAVALEGDGAGLADGDLAVHHQAVPPRRDAPRDALPVGQHRDVPRARRHREVDVLAQEAIPTHERVAVALGVRARSHRAAPAQRDRDDGEVIVEQHQPAVVARPRVAVGRDPADPPRAVLTEVGDRPELFEHRIARCADRQHAHARLADSGRVERVAPEGVRLDRAALPLRARARRRRSRRPLPVLHTCVGRHADERRRRRSDQHDRRDAAGQVEAMGQGLGQLPQLELGPRSSFALRGQPLRGLRAIALRWLHPGNGQAPWLYEAQRVVQPGWQPVEVRVRPAIVERYPTTLAAHGHEASIGRELHVDDRRQARVERVPHSPRGGLDPHQPPVVGADDQRLTRDDHRRRPAHPGRQRRTDPIPPRVDDPRAQLAIGAQRVPACARRARVRRRRDHDGATLEAQAAELDHGAAVHPRHLPRPDDCREALAAVRAFVGQGRRVLGHQGAARVEHDDAIRRADDRSAVLEQRRRLLRLDAVAPAALERRQLPALHPIAERAQHIGAIGARRDGPAAGRQGMLGDPRRPRRHPERRQHPTRARVGEQRQRARRQHLGLGSGACPRACSRLAEQRLRQVPRRLTQGACELVRGLQRLAFGLHCAGALTLGGRRAEADRDRDADQRQHTNRDRHPPRAHDAHEELPGRVAVSAHPAPVEPRRQVGGQRLRVRVPRVSIGRGRLLDDRLELDLLAPARGDDLTQDRAEAPHVRAGVDVFAALLLGAHVAAGAGAAARRESLAIDLDGEPPVEDLGLAELAQHQVRGLQVAVHDARVVRVADRFDDGQHRA